MDCIKNKVIRLETRIKGLRIVHRIDLLDHYYYCNKHRGLFYMPSMKFKYKGKKVHGIGLNNYLAWS